MRLLIIAAFLSIAAAAQNPAQIQPTPTTPSGACNSTAIRLLTPNGTIYTCQGGTWAASSGSGGGFDTADGFSGSWAEDFYGDIAQHVIDNNEVDWPEQLVEFDLGLEELPRLVA